MLNVTFSDIQKIVNESLEELFTKDGWLLEDNVSERAITHKFAEYLQQRIPYLHVDCEYNRNATRGQNASKDVRMQARDLREELLNKNSDEFESVSTYPDIIVHRRRTNDSNLLVIEVKKSNSQVKDDYDKLKLKAFTENTEQNSYHFRFGVFIRLTTGKPTTEQEEMLWFSEGKEIDNNGYTAHELTTY